MNIPNKIFHIRHIMHVAKTSVSNMATEVETVSCFSSTIMTRLEYNRWNRGGTLNDLLNNSQDSFISHLQQINNSLFYIPFQPTNLQHSWYVELTLHWFRSLVLIPTLLFYLILSQTSSTMQLQQPTCCRVKPWYLVKRRWTRKSAMYSENIWLTSVRRR